MVHRPNQGILRRANAWVSTSIVGWYTFELVGLGFMVGTNLTALSTGFYPIPEGSDRLWRHSILRGMITCTLTMGLPLCNAVMLRRACVNRAIVEEGGEPSSAFEVDEESAWATTKWWCVAVALYSCGEISGGGDGATNGLIASLVYLMFSVLPWSCDKWHADFHIGLPTTRKHLARAAQVSLIPTLLFTLFTLNYIPYLFNVTSASNLNVIFPPMLSLTEALAQRLYSDSVLEGHSDEAVSVWARFLWSYIESIRVGLLVILYNTGAGTMEGLIIATVSSSILEILSRNATFDLGVDFALPHLHRWVRCAFNTCMCQRQRPQPASPRRVPPPPLPPATPPPPPSIPPLSRFQRVYLGCKGDVSVWPIATLLIVALTGEGGITSHPYHEVISTGADNNGPPPPDHPSLGVPDGSSSSSSGGGGGGDASQQQLEPAMDTGAAAIAIVLTGVLVSNAGSWGLRRVIRRWRPQMGVADLVVGAKPRGGVMFLLGMWKVVGDNALNGLMSMGGGIDGFGGEEDAVGGVPMVPPPVSSQP